MRVPARVFADEQLLERIRRDRSLQQLVNVTALPGIVDAALGMPDMHQGYGFPVGGVAATALPDGVISPGGIGFDINCGVRLLASQLGQDDIEPWLEALVHEISLSIPAGYGRSGRLALTREEMDRVLVEGCLWLPKIHQQSWPLPESVDLLSTRRGSRLQHAPSGKKACLSAAGGRPRLSSVRHHAAARS